MRNRRERANRCCRDCLKYRLKDSELQRPSALMSSSPKPLSDACWAAPRRKLWPEYLGAVWPYKLAALFRRVAIIQSRVMGVSSKPNRGLLQYNGCTLKRPRNACTGHVEVPVAAKIISTPRWAVSDLLLLSRKTAWESSSENVISDLVRRLCLYVEALSRSWEFWTVNSPIHKKPAKVTLQAVSKLQSLIESDDTSGDVSCSKRAWVIGVACF